MRIVKGGLAAVLCMMAFTSQPAKALTFNLIDTGGAAAGTQARTGFDAAAHFWSSVLTNPVTINLDIGFQSLGAGILGSTSSNPALLSMAQGYSALAASSTSTLDTMAVAGLQPLSASSVLSGNTAVIATTNAINVTRNGYLDNATRIDDDGGVNNSALAMSRANAKALGLTTDVNGQAIVGSAVDGSITFSSGFAFDFNPVDGINPMNYDFIGVAIHEIGHALGFVSGVDTYDARTGPGGPNATGGLLEPLVVTSTLDLFRYSAPGVIDWSTSAATKYFSIDGGQNQLFGNAPFALGLHNGDGNQASHWLESPAGQPQLGILDPTSGFGQMQSVTALDLAAFDAIGWTVGMDVLDNSKYRFTTAQAAADVPEPAGWMLMIVGFGAIGLSVRRQRRGTRAAL